MSNFQNGCEDLAREFFSRVMQAGELSSDGSYRYGGGIPDEDELLRRAINNISLYSNRSKMYKAALIEVNQEKIQSIKSTLHSQIRIICKSTVDESTANKIADDLSSVLVNSWYHVVRF
jgi:hypothetical protein